MLSFDFLKESLGLVFPSHFAYKFQEKFFCYILLTDQISLFDYLYF